MDINRTRQGYLAGSSPEAALALCGFNILKLGAMTGLPSEETAYSIKLDEVGTVGKKKKKVPRK